MPKLYPLNEFGVEVRTFCAKTSFTLKEICDACGTNYDTVRQAMTGRTAGHSVKPKIREFIKNHTETA